MKRDKLKVILLIVAIILAGIAPNLFPIAQAGYSKLSTLALYYLIPSIILIFAIVFVSRGMHFNDLRKQLLYGLVAGLIATVGLEIVREIGFHTQWMPGDMPKLLGVLVLDRFALGPNFWSNLAGWGYHFWNGAAFGIIFSLVFSRTKTIWAVVYGVLIGVGFMVSPAVKAMGIGVFGVEYMAGYEFLTVVTAAHIAYGIILGLLLRKWNKGTLNIFTRIREAFFPGNHRSASNT